MEGYHLKTQKYNTIYSYMYMNNLPIHRVLLDSPCMNPKMFLWVSTTTRPNVTVATELARD